MKTRQQLEDDLASTEGKWLKADACVHMMHAVLQCAQEKLSSGDEACSWQLLDAAKLVANSYVEKQ